MISLPRTPYRRTLEIVAAAELVESVEGATGLGGEADEGTDLFGAASLDDVARIEALPAQDGILGARVRAPLVLF